MRDIGTVLIIDDDQDDQDLFVEIVNELNPSLYCIRASGANQALALLQNRLVNLPIYIFLDLNMPGMNGRECLKSLKENVLFQHIPVIIYSTSSSAKDKQETTDLGAAYFITKASNITSLKTEIQSVLSSEFINRG